MNKKVAIFEWIDEQLKVNPQLAQEVDEILEGMRLEQDLTALREGRNLSQRPLGTSERHVTKLESGRVKKIGVSRAKRAS